jgi:hypothetical protein
MRRSPCAVDRMSRWHRYRDRAGPLTLDKTREERGLLTGQNRGPTPGHQWGLFMATDRSSHASSMSASSARARGQAEDYQRYFEDLAVRMSETNPSRAHRPLKRWRCTASSTATASDLIDQVLTPEGRGTSSQQRLRLLTTSGRTVCRGDLVQGQIRGVLTRQPLPPSSLPQEPPDRTYEIRSSCQRWGPARKKRPPDRRLPGPQRTVRRGTLVSEYVRRREDIDVRAAQT